MWQVAPLLAEGKLVHLLPGCVQPANVWAVYPMRLERSAKLRVAVEFLVQWFQPRAPLAGVAKSAK
jgi:LysR family transcriptional activator of dmlA